MEMSKILGIIIGATVGMIFLGYLMAPIITELTAEGGALAGYSALVGVIPVMVIIVVLIAVIAPLMKGRDL